MLSSKLRESDCAAVCSAVARMLYYPSSTPEAEQLAYAPVAGLAPWMDAAGARIGWTREPADATQRWLVFHGNAGLAVQRAYWADALERVSPGQVPAVYILEYPGYSWRLGTPTQTSITAAALTAIDAIPGAEKIHLLGESLGCAVAAQVAQALPERVGGLVLVSPFNRLSDVAAHHYPWLPVRWLVKDRWEFDSALRDFSGPEAIIAAERDSIVPAIYAQRLNDDFPGRKRLQVVPGEDHNFFVFDPQWFREAVTFTTVKE